VARRIYEVELPFVAWADVPTEGRERTGERRIYALVDPRDERVRYVGVTRRTLASRVEKHIEKPTNAEMGAWFAELKKAALAPEPRELERPTAWASAERWWISWFRARGRLLNVDVGGNCRDGRGKLFPWAKDLATKLRREREREAELGLSARVDRKGKARKISEVEWLQRVRASGPVTKWSPEKVAEMNESLALATERDAWAPTPPSQIGRRGSRSEDRATRTWAKDAARPPIVTADIEVEASRRARLGAKLPLEARARLGYKTIRWRRCGSCRAFAPHERGGAYRPLAGYEVFHGAGCSGETWAYVSKGARKKQRKRARAETRRAREVRRGPIRAIPVEFVKRRTAKEEGA
jgi:hypothetical protein